MHRQAKPMRLALLAVVLACCRADEARRRPARPMRQRDVDRWRARQRQHTYKPPAGARDAFKEQLARLRQQTIDAKHKQQPPPQAPHRPTPETLKSPSKSGLSRAMPVVCPASVVPLVGGLFCQSAPVSCTDLLSCMPVRITIHKLQNNGFIVTAKCFLVTERVIVALGFSKFSRP